MRLDFVLKLFRCFRLLVKMKIGNQNTVQATTKAVIPLPSQEQTLGDYRKPYLYVLTLSSYKTSAHSPGPPSEFRGPGEKENDEAPASEVARKF